MATAGPYRAPLVAKGIAADPSATAPTPTPVPLFLPVALGEDCPSATRFVAAALVIDTSPAMGALAVGGESKLTLAARGATRFVDGLRLGDAADQAAIVAFAGTVTVQPLTSSRGALQSALDALKVSSGMRLDLAFTAARQALAGAKAGDLPALVLVVAGSVPNEGRSTALNESAALRRGGAVVFVVNAGSPDEALLKVLAGSPARYLPVPDARLLPSTIGGLVRRIQCAPEAYWGRR